MLDLIFIAAAGMTSVAPVVFCDELLFGPALEFPGIPCPDTSQ
jgi:hypothetical protein